MSITPTTPTLLTPAPSLGDRIYSTAIEAEKAKSIFNAVIGTIVGLCLLSVAIYLITKKDSLTAETDATITSSTCNVVTSGQNYTYNCTMVVSYTINGNTYTQSLITNSSTQYVNGTTIRIKYNPSNPSEIAVKSLSNSTIGFILIGVALCIVIGSWVMMYLTRKYEGVAALSAISDVSSAIRGRP